MAIKIINSQPSESTTLTPLFVSTEFSKRSIKKKIGVGQIPTSETIDLSLKDYSNDKYEKIILVYQQFGDDILDLSGFESGSEIEESSYELELDFNKLAILGIGNYKSSIEFKVIGVNETLNIEEEIDTFNFETEFDVDGGDFSISNDIITFYHVKNTTPTVSIPVTITNDGNWELLNPLNENNNSILVNGQNEQEMYFSNDQTIHISLNEDVNILPIGVHEAKIHFYNPNYVGELIINIAITENDEITIEPDELVFHAIQGIIEADWQEINLIGGTSFTNFQKSSWCEMQVVNHPDIPNFVKVKIKPINSLNLSQGNYNGLFKCKNGSKNLQVPIKHTLYSYWNKDYDQDIHFSKNNEELEFFTQTIEDSYLKVSAEIIISNYDGTIKTLNRDWRLQFIDNIAKFNLGREIHDYLNLAISIPRDLNFGKLKAAYLPLVVKITAREYQYENEQMVTVYYIPPQYFLRGRKPNIEGDFWATHHQEITHRVTANSIVNLNIYKSKGIAKKLYIKRNGLVVGDIDFTHQHLPCFLHRIFDFSTLENLEAGEKISFTYGDVTQNYIVFPEAKNSIHIGYVDQFQLLKIFEFTGKMVNVGEIENQTSEVYSNWREILRKIRSSHNQTITLNTGFIPKSNVRIIDDICFSKKAFLITTIDKIAIELVPVSKKLTLEDTDEGLYMYDVEFKVNNLYEDAIYL